MDNQQNVNVTQVNAPSIYGLTCPKCQGGDFKIKGIKGSYGKSVGMGMAFGAIGNLVANSMSKEDFSPQPIEYKCTSCKNKFEALPFMAGKDELLEQACTVNFKRKSSFVGMAIKYHVWINGVKVGVVGNGKSFSFPVITKYNTMFVTDQYGVAFKTDYKFEAQSGGNVNVNFKRKFVQ